ncbi:MAG: nucleotide exchange factor GrpE [Armatimonadetes bacterium RBG_16_67_12]|nr:MAG: nucleotide exchange factor GrpE [Armatimonadetes bacterium RBG_16_67_12]
MFERYTERARRVIILAQEEAKRLGHSTVGTEHVLLGIIREGDGVASKVLKNLNISSERVRAEIEDAIGRGERAPHEEVEFSPRAKKVLDLAKVEARHLGHNYIGTEHLLLSLIHEGEGVAARVLEAFGADLARVRAQTLDLPGEDGAMPLASAPQRDDAAARDRLEAEVARLTEEAARNWQQFLRAAADLENYRKQAIRQREEAVAITRRVMLAVILGVVDTLERALQHAGITGPADGNSGNSGGAVDAIADGIRLAHRQVLDTLKTMGVRPMESVGQAFDPRVHEAVEAVAASGDVTSGTIVGEVQRGYMIGEEVLRPARVRVAQ